MRTLGRFPRSLACVLALATAGACGGDGSPASSDTGGGSDDAGAIDAAAGVDGGGADEGDGATSGDATTDARGNGDGAAPCTTAGTELCEDFESGAIDPKKWSKRTTSGGSLLVDGVHVHSGTHALHVKVTPGQQSTAQITDTVTFPAASNTLYARAWFYFFPDLPSDNNGGYHMGYVLASGNDDLGFVEGGLGSAGPKAWLGYSEYYGSGPSSRTHGATFTEFGPESPTHVTPQTWVCVELMQGGDATTVHRRIWVNDVELTEQKSDYSGRQPPTFDLLAIGVWQYHVTPVLSDVWVDDIRVSSARIGCAAPPP